MKRGLNAVLACAVGAIGFTAVESQAAVLYSTSGATYTQDFNSLPISPTNASLGTSPAGWIDDTASPGATNFSIVGWYLNHPTNQSEGGANGNQRVRAGTGSSGTGAFWSYGASSNTERALGIQPATTLATDGDSMRIGLQLTNTTGETLTSFTITYDGEQYRDEVATSSLNLSYGIGLTPGENGTWHSAPSGATPGSVSFVPAAAFTAPVTGNTGATVDGNAAGKTANITATVTLAPGNEWTPGSDLWIRWSEVQVAGSTDDGLGIDNVRFSAVPEPTCLAALALGGMGLMGRRRIR